MPPAPPAFDPLEPRLLLSTVAWDGGGDGLSWHDPLNWSEDQVPLADDDVVIEGAGGAIEYSALAGDSSIRSLLSDRALVLTGGSLSVADTVALSAAAGGQLGQSLPVTRANGTVEILPPPEPNAARDHHLFE